MAAHRGCLKQLKIHTYLKRVEDRRNNRDFGRRSGHSPKPDCPQAQIQTARTRPEGTGGLGFPIPGAVSAGPTEAQPVCWAAPAPPLPHQHRLLTSRPCPPGAEVNGASRGGEEPAKPAQTTKQQCAERTGINRQYKKNMFHMCVFHKQKKGYIF